MFVLAGVAAGITLSCNTNMMNDVHAGSKAASGKSVEVKTNTALIGMSNALADVAEGVTPSVVNISTTKIIRRQFTNPFFDDPFFKRFFGDGFGNGMQREYRQRSLGSGVIVSEDGYIVTNNHVVEGADDISVILHDKEEYTGEVVGADPRSDVAVIKIDAKGLPAAGWGDSDALRPGEMIMAIGSPFGLSKTVTVGIVSATGRANVGIADYEDFIQTDAAINPGNSGGALVNMKGELVGINTAIFSRSGGYQGIGFAVPSKMVRQVMESLINTGEVVRGWLGVSIQELNPQLAKQFGLEDVNGALVADVVKDSPAEKAGIKQGDVIIQFGGRSVEDAAHLRNMVAGTLADTKVDVVVIRDNTEKTLEVNIGTLTAEAAGETVTAGGGKNALSGLTVQDLTPDLRDRLGLDADAKGVIIGKVDPASLAAEAGLEEGDLIVSINKTNVGDVKAYKEVTAKLGEEEPVLLLISRKGSALWVSVGP